MANNFNDFGGYYRDTECGIIILWEKFTAGRFSRRLPGDEFSEGWGALRNKQNYNPDNENSSLEMELNNTIITFNILFV
jgi:hypothetical protein